MHPSDEMIAKTQFVVEATSNETQMLWEKFCKDSLTRHIWKNTRDGDVCFNKHTWIQHNPGYLVTVGEVTIDGEVFPVNISCCWYTIDGLLVMFYEAVSMVTHHKMIQDWLEKNCPCRWDGGTRLAHTNAMNFHHVLDHCREVNRTKKDYRA